MELELLAMPRDKVSISTDLGRINLDDLASEYANTGPKAIWLAEVAAASLGAFRRFTVAVEVAKAESGRRARERRSAVGDKITERLIEEDVILDPAVRQAEELAIRSEEQWHLLRAVSFTLDQKMRLLTSLAGPVNREMDARTAYRERFQAEMRQAQARGRVVKTIPKAKPAPKATRRATAKPPRRPVL